MPISHPIPTLIAALDDMTDDQIREAHRIVSRRARAVYARDPRYQQNYAAGLAASHSARKREAASPSIGTAA